MEFDFFTRGFIKNTLIFVCLMNGHMEGLGDATKHPVLSNGAERQIQPFISAIDGSYLDRAMDDLHLYSLKFNPSCSYRNKWLDAA